MLPTAHGPARRTVPAASSCSVPAVHSPMAQPRSPSPETADRSAEPSPYGAGTGPTVGSGNPCGTQHTRGHDPRRHGPDGSSFGEGGRGPAPRGPVGVAARGQTRRRYRSGAGPDNPAARRAGQRQQRAAGASADAARPAGAANAASRRSSRSVAGAAAVLGRRPTARADPLAPDPGYG